ncbi:hypothetical protein H0H92_005270 [Tricholoma furcatifolium]|nr:hypothetical protein H0H92_005270 [Tricholoma furcatifolium]
MSLPKEPTPLSHQANPVPDSPPPPYTARAAPSDSCAQRIRVINNDPAAIAALGLMQYHDSEPDERLPTNPAILRQLPRVGSNRMRYVVGMAPQPEHLCPPGPNDNVTAFYVVTIGQEVGVFWSWSTVKSVTNRVPGNAHCRVTSWDEGVRKYMDAYQRNEVEVRILV